MPSIISHGDQYEPFRDLDLHALLAVLDYLASEDPAAYAGAADTLAAWIESARDSGNNTIDLDLDLLALPPPRERMLALMTHLEAEVPRRWPDGVPTEIGNRVRAYPPPSPWLVAPLVAASARLRGLIERTVGRVLDR